MSRSPSVPAGAGPVAGLADRVSFVAAWIGAPAFRRIWRFDRALRGKLTPAGWLLGALLVGSMTLGLNTRESLLYQFFALAVAIFLAASIAAWRRPLRARVERRLPPTATAGVPFEYVVRMTNEGAAVDRVLAEDLLVLPRANVTQFARFKVAADRGRNAFDRLVGYPRFVAYMRSRMGARIDPVTLDRVAASSARELRFRCTPARRGLVEFAAVRFSRPEPLGLVKAHAWYALPATLVVLPRTFPAAALDLPGTRRLQPGGVAFAGRVGDAEEFMSLRDYRDGDGPRRIHWKAWARTGQLVVKEYQEEFFVRHALVLDTFGSPAHEVFEAAVSLAASMVVQPRSNDSLLDLMFVEDRAYTFTQGRGLGAPPDLLRVLATVAATASAGFEPLAEAVDLAAGRLSGAICVLLAWDAPRQRMVAGLRERGIPVRVWLVQEGGPPPGLGPMADDPRNFRVVAPAQLAQALATP